MLLTMHHYYSIWSPWYVNYCNFKSYLRYLNPGTIVKIQRSPLSLFLSVLFSQEHVITDNPLLQIECKSQEVEIPFHWDITPDLLYKLTNPFSQAKASKCSISKHSSNWDLTDSLENIVDLVLASGPDISSS